ncbi:MAG TPA: hypothetical protein PKA63_09140 [Oligoflexia bacterium]|nr:hypothetical protein [Oligoflexia bacterium]HMP48817.1 hypothetical protein [Oligoflexia bacterium]
MNYSRYIVLSLVLLLSSCHSMKFEISDAPAGRVIKDSKPFFLFGVIPTQEVDLGTICPEGTISVAESTTFLDGFLGLITLGIYTPRSSTYTCRGGN